MVRLFILFMLMWRIGCGLTITPPILHEEFRDGVIAENITVANDTLERKRYRIEVVGADDYRNWSLEKETKVFPKIISLEPKSRKDIRVRIVKKDITDGEYKGYLIIREIPINIDYKEYSEMERISTKLKLVNNYWLSIYGTYGKLDRSIDVESEIAGNIITTKARSIGNCGRGLWMEVSIANKEGEIRRENLGVSRVMRGEEVEKTKEIDLQKGEEIVSVKYYDPRGDGRR